MPGLQPQDNRGYFMLPQAPEDAGYYVYGTPEQGAGQYAHPVMLSVLFWVEHQWQATDRRRFGIGNISMANGPTFWPHAGHRNGLQVDVRAIRLDGKHMGVRWQHEGYDSVATDRLVGIFRTHPSVIKIYFNDTEIHGVWPMIHHDDHFHVELRGGAA
jgi:penicillin-insensitive murein endopeptidase